MRRRHATRIALFVFLVGLGRSAHAADASPAETLFVEGNALAAAGRYGEACPRLAESQRLEPAVGTEFNLADCYEHLGRTATAFTLFEDVAKIARAAGKFERERLAKERALALAPRLARLRVVVAKAAPGQEVTDDGAKMAAERWGTPVPIDPGAHRLAASAPNRMPWEGTVTAAEGVTTEITIPPLIDPTPVQHPRSAENGGSTTRRTIATAALAASAAGLLVGAIAGVRAIALKDRAEEACPEATYHYRCPTLGGADDWNAARTAGTVSTVGFITFGAALVTAAAVWFTAPSPRLRTSWRGFGLEGSF
jgi:tetratricopeptide (TPR) repeat protein